MLLGPSKLYLAFLATVLVIATQACAVSQQSTADATVTATYTQPSSVKSPTSLVSITMIGSATPAATPAENASSPSPTTAFVTVTAVKGRLSIRSGPDISFDAVALLENGQTATAVARSIIDGWIQISIPSQPSKVGWVSTMTAHSIVIGNVLDLPRIDEVDWPVGSFILNCTQHRLIVKPGEQVVQPASVTTQNRVWFAPGLYSIYDLDMSGQPLVLNLNIRAHGQVTVHRDGSHQWSECP
jgi:hypothetical protein